ncbi:MAG: hypothetical protein ACOYJA_10915 [Christensenellales bacterium]|jgi:beta-fructofuranosidase
MEKQTALRRVAQLSLGRGRREAVSLSSRPAFSLIVDLMEGGAGEVRLADTAGQDVLRLISDGARVTVAYRCAGREQPLTLDAPLGGARQLMLIATGYSLGLYDPAELMDENWPLGPMAGDVAEAEYTAKRVQLFDGALSLPPQGLETIACPQYWTPKGHNTGVGDCMPFSDGDTLRLYYLQDRRSHRSKWGLGAHQWAQIATKDLRHFTGYPMAVGITHDWEGSICTGSIIRHEGLYYAFYAVRMSDGSPAQLSWATSADGVCFAKSEQYFSLQPPYQGPPARDPMVFAHGGQFHMLVTTELIDPPLPGKGGCLAHLTSPDLVHWQQREPLLTPGFCDQPECSDLFEMGGRWYLLFSHGGVAHYAFADDPLGPYTHPAQDTLDGNCYRVPKTAALGGRRFAAGFLCRENYAGALVWRELVQRPDGVLGTRFAPELCPEAGAPARVDVAALSGVWTPAAGEGVCGELRSPGYGLITCPLPADHFRLDCDLTLAPGTPRAGLALFPDADYRQGHELVLEPELRRAGIFPIERAPYAQRDETCLMGVEAPEGRYGLTLFAVDDIVDVCVNGGRTLVCRLPRFGARLGLFVQFGALTVSGLTLRPLTGGRP